MFEQIEKLRILVLEDDDIDRIQVKRLLAKSSLSEYEVDYAKLLSEALDFLKQRSFHVILSDLNVPDSTGIETLTKMNKQCPEAVIIAVTGQSDKEHGRKAIEEGAQDYLVKGKFDEYDLSKAIEHAVHRKQMEIEKEKMQTQLRQAQKMEAIGTLAGGIAHDFNNMLGAMIGYANLVLQDIPENSITYRNQQEVLVAANRARELVKQILTFGREGEESKNKLKISSIVKEALETLSSSLPENIKLQKNIDAESSLIMANLIHIHQIMMNLCTNAYHAMEEKGGTLEVDLVDTDFDSDTMIGHTKIKQGNYVKLKVSDTGYGMSNEIINRIFEPFFTTKEVGKGTGMGLSVVHGIVKKCGASIVIESEVGKGTSFSIFFPKINDESENIIKPKPESKTKGRILLVDDEEVMVDVTTQILERLGYNVTGKTSSTEALELFNKNPDKFDLVITDHRMPKMKGTKLAQELISIKPDIPVILCTGFSEDIGKEKTKEMGIKEYLMKPVTNLELSETINKILNNQEVTI